MNKLTIFTGNANRALAENICASLEVSLGEMDVERFRKPFQGEGKITADPDEDHALAAPRCVFIELPDLYVAHRGVYGEEKTDDLDNVSEIREGYFVQVLRNGGKLRRGGEWPDDPSRQRVSPVLEKNHLFHGRPAVRISYQQKQ